MNNKGTESGGLPLANTDNRMFSLLCMSCHDGVTTPTVIGPTSVSAVGNVTNSGGLTNDHPINMSHNPATDAGLATPGNVTAGGLVLYGTTNTVQCGSCHDSHDNTNGKFLRKPNTGSALCTTCHI
jgi:predicted CXXCH cytochrome family protein